VDTPYPGNKKGIKRQKPTKVRHTGGQSKEASRNKAARGNGKTGVGTMGGASEYSQQTTKKKKWGRKGKKRKRIDEWNSKNWLLIVNSHCALIANRSGKGPKGMSGGRREDMVGGGGGGLHDESP